MPAIPSFPYRRDLRPAQIESLGEYTDNEFSKIEDAIVRINSTALEGTPATSSDLGSPGDVRWDGSYIYVCVAPNTWRRAATASW